MRTIEIRQLGALFFALLFMFTALPKAHAAGNTIEIEADKPEVAIDDLLRVEVTLTLEDEDSVDRVKMPSFDNFRIVNQNTSSQHYTSIVNFKVTSKKTRVTTFILQPLDVGEFTLGPAGFIENGKRVQSNLAKVTVYDPNTPADEGEDAPINAGANERGKTLTGKQALHAPLTPEEEKSPDAFVRLVVEKSSLYEGEQMAATLYLYVTDRAGITRWGRVAQSNFPGFGVEQLEADKNDVHRLMLNRRSYRVEALDRFLLTAKEPGKQYITPYRVKLLSGDGFFGGRWISRQTESVEISIKALPTEGQPPNFHSYYVGKFQLNAHIDRGRTEVGQPVALTIELRANRNIDDIRLRKIENIQGAKIFPPTVKTQNYQRGDRFEGRRTVEYLIVPKREGVIGIPSLSVDYFNPETGHYETASTKTFRIRAVMTGEAADGQPQGETVNKQELTISEENLRPLHPGAKFENRTGETSGRVLFWGILALGLGLLALLLLFDFISWLLPRIQGGEKAEMAKRLKSLWEAFSDSEGKSANERAKLLKEWLRLQLILQKNADIQGLTHEQTALMLLEAGEREARVEELIELLETLDAIRYAPGNADIASLAESVQAWVKGGGQ